VVGVPVPMILDASCADVIYGFTGACILLAVTITQGIIFIPKVISVTVKLDSFFASLYIAEYARVRHR
jgi:hypothetical protein